MTPSDDNTLQEFVDRFRRLADDAMRASMFVRSAVLNSPEFAAASEDEQASLLSLLADQTVLVSDFKSDTNSHLTAIADIIAKVRQRQPSS